VALLPFFRSNLLKIAENIPLRQNFPDLADEQKYLYLEGLKKFHHTGKDDPLSYFQIAGE